MGRKKKEWLTTLDGRERPEHGSANGQVVLQQDAFTVGGERLMYPGDPAGSPWNTINCRCTVLPVVGEEAIPGEQPSQPSSVGFIPAMTKDEVYERIGKYVDDYQLKDLPLDKQNTILRAVEEVLGKHNIRIDGLLYQKGRRRSYGHAYRLGTKTYVEIQKTYLSQTQKKAIEQAELFAKKKARELSAIQTRLADERMMQQASYRRYWTDRLERCEKQQRWAIFQDASDPLDAVVRHELYHTVDFRYNVSGKLAKEINTRKLTGDWPRISEYAQASAKETFAELATAIDTNVSVPQSLVELYQEVMREHAK